MNCVKKIERIIYCGDFFVLFFFMFCSLIVIPGVIIAKFFDVLRAGAIGNTGIEGDFWGRQRVSCFFA